MADISLAALQAQIQKTLSLLKGYVRLSGLNVMPPEGRLFLGNDPRGDLEAATKHYVDINHGSGTSSGGTGPPGPKGDKGDTGNPGPTGSTGPAGAGTTWINGTAGITLNGHRFVVLNDADLLVYADNTIPSHTHALAGMTVSAFASGTTASVVTSGTVTEPSWAWTPRLPIFLGTGGIPTQTLPTSGFILCVGTALSSTTLLVRIDPPIVPSS